MSCFNSFVHRLVLGVVLLSSVSAWGQTWQQFYLVNNYTNIIWQCIGGSSGGTKYGTAAYVSLGLGTHGPYGCYNYGVAVGGVQNWTYYHVDQVAHNVNTLVESTAFGYVYYFNIGPPLTWYLSALTLQNLDSIPRYYNVLTNGTYAVIMKQIASGSSWTYSVSNSSPITVTGERLGYLGDNVDATYTGVLNTNAVPTVFVNQGPGGTAGNVYSGGSTNIEWGTNAVSIGDSAVFDAITKFANQAHQDSVNNAKSNSVSVSVTSTNNVTVNVTNSHPITVTNAVDLAGMTNLLRQLVNSNSASYARSEVLSSNLTAFYASGGVSNTLSTYFNSVTTPLGASKDVFAAGKIGSIDDIGAPNMVLEWHVLGDHYSVDLNPANDAYWGEFFAMVREFFVWVITLVYWVAVVRLFKEQWDRFMSIGPLKLGTVMALGSPVAWLTAGAVLLAWAAAVKFGVGWIGEWLTGNHSMVTLISTNVFAAHKGTFAMALYLFDLVFPFDYLLTCIVSYLALWIGSIIMMMAANILLKGAVLAVVLLMAVASSQAADGFPSDTNLCDVAAVNASDGVIEVWAGATNKANLPAGFSGRLLLAAGDYDFRLIGGSTVGSATLSGGGKVALQAVGRVGDGSVVAGAVVLLHDVPGVGSGRVAAVRSGVYWFAGFFLVGLTIRMARAAGRSWGSQPDV